jgi:transcriptional regulator with XRE-family HTH domain
MGEPLLSPATRAPGGSLPPQTRWSAQVALGTRIRNSRLAIAMSQSDLAGGLTTIAYLSRIEAGERWPSPALFADLARRLQVDLADLTRGRAPVLEGLRFELTHADFLLGSGRFDDAVRVCGDLSEVATSLKAPEVVTAAQIIQARAAAAAGHNRAALRIVQPLVSGTTALPALVASARFHLTLSDFSGAIAVGRRAADRIVSGDRISLPESADLAVTVAIAYRACGRESAARHVARLALKQLPDELDSWENAQPAGASTLAVSYRNFERAVRHIELGVASLDLAALQHDVETLRELAGPPQDVSMEAHDE